MVNVLVTGCGGVIGLNIGRILKKFKINNYGCDINDIHPGNFFYKKCFKILPVSDINYLNQIKKIVEDLKISLIIPTTEKEISFFQNNRFMKIILIDKIHFNIFSDKFETFNFLKENGLPHPKTISLDKVNEKKLLNYPFILKGKKGCGNKNVYTIENEEDFKYYIKKIKEKDKYLVQEYLDGEEYTCCIYSSGKIYEKIILKRILENGHTKQGEVVNIESINNLLDEIKKITGIIGSYNIQLRLVKGIPYIFEINPRFSSTIYFRYLLNFNDLIWSINDSLCTNILTEEYNFLNIIGKKFSHCNEHYILN